MTGELAQLINLITHFNSGNVTADLFSTNSTYEYCNTLNFVGLKKKFFGGFKETEVANGTKEWFEYLQKNKCNELLLVFQSDNSMESDHKLAGMVGGGGNWFIEAKNSGFSDFWQARWEVKPNQKDGDNRIWDISYGLVLPHETHFEHPEYDITLQRDKLKKILTRISEFASSNDSTSGWEKTFNEALSAFDQELPKLGYHKDLIPENSLSKDNLQLLIAASKSFVFGGMGSWNDIGSFNNEELAQAYEDLSAELYDVMTESIISAVNGKD